MTHTRDDAHESFLSEHALALGIFLWIASVICMFFGCLLYTVGMNAVYWNMLREADFMPYAYLGLPLIIVGFVLSISVLILWYYGN